MFLSITLQFIALINLSLSMHKHFKTIINKQPKSLTIFYLKIVGWLSIICSVLLVFTLPIMYLIYWLGFLSLEILIIAIFYAILQK